MAPKANPAYIYPDNGPGKGKPHMWRVCEECGELKLIANQSKLCSRACGARRQHREGRSRQLSGTDHYAWKGDEAGYQALHHRILAARGKADHCEWREQTGCKSRKYEWAHIHGTGAGNPENYISLCKTCHASYDEQIGSGHANAKVTDEQVRAIRERYAAGGISQQALGALFGVHQGTISKIVLGKTYRAA